MNSDSVELSDADVCLLQIQLLGTNVQLPKFHETSTEVVFESSRSPAESETRKNPVDNAEPCCPHDSIVGIHLCDESMNSILPIVCRMPESVL